MSPETGPQRALGVRPGMSIRPGSDPNDCRFCKGEAGKPRRFRTPSGPVIPAEAGIQGASIVVLHGLPGHALFARTHNCTSHSSTPSSASTSSTDFRVFVWSNRRQTWAADVPIRLAISRRLSGLVLRRR